MKLFISYRRETGIDIAARIKDFFVARGHTVFYDINSMRIGDFEKQIKENIEICDCFIVVLTEGALDSDWVRKEIKCALENKRTIVPLIMPNFKKPNNLPVDISGIMSLHGVEYNAVLFEQVMLKLNNLIIGETVDDIFLIILKDLYGFSIEFRSAIMHGQQEKINEVVPLLLGKIEDLYCYREKSVFKHHNESEVALEIITKWNDFVQHYNNFVNIMDRMSIEAQKEAQIADKLYKEYIDLILLNINKNIQ